MTPPSLTALFQSGVAWKDITENTTVSYAGHPQIFNGVSIWAISTREKWMAK